MDLAIVGVGCWIKMNGSRSCGRSASPWAVLVSTPLRAKNAEQLLIG